jgi:RNA polymerase sigma-70 factor (ECF subfamily)
MRRGDLTMPPNEGSATFERDLVALIPQLRALSRTLCGKQGIADDMAQEALAKAWGARDRFEPGTNLKAWLFTILRHEFYSHMRRAWRETRWDEQLGEQIPAPADEQVWAMDLSDCARAIGALPQRQREALLMVGAAGHTYGEAADFLGEAVGSVKSRMARGRGELVKFFEGKKPLPRRSPMTAAAATDSILSQLAEVRGAHADRVAHG